MHIAIIPARKGSQGFKYKNRLFFNNTGNFLDSVSWFDNIIVSTNDAVIMKYAKNRNYTIHKRPEKLAGPKISIKYVFQCIIDDLNIMKDDILWLFYLPILYKNIEDFIACKSIIERPKYKSLCSFVPAKSHPFNCWKYDKKSKTLSQYTPNDVFRRQDLPPAWIHYHYVCCLKAGELSSLNNELINSNTYPYFLNSQTTENLIEIDTPEDYEKWKSLYLKKGADVSEEAGYRKLK